MTVGTSEACTDQSHANPQLPRDSRHRGRFRTLCEPWNPISETLNPPLRGNNKRREKERERERERERLQGAAHQRPRRPRLGFRGAGIEALQGSASWFPDGTQLLLGCVCVCAFGPRVGGYEALGFHCRSSAQPKPKARSNPKPKP